MADAIVGRHESRCDHVVAGIDWGNFSSDPNTNVAAKSSVPTIVFLRAPFTPLQNTIFTSVAADTIHSTECTANDNLSSRNQRDAS